MNVAVSQKKTNKKKTINCYTTSFLSCSSLPLTRAMISCHDGSTSNIKLNSSVLIWIFLLTFAAFDSKVLFPSVLVFCSKEESNVWVTCLSSPHNISNILSIKPRFVWCSAKIYQIIQPLKPNYSTTKTIIKTFFSQTLLFAEKGMKIIILSFWSYFQIFRL